MSDFIILKDRSECPSCRRESVSSYFPSQCRNCGMMLFDRSNDLTKYESETGWREYWVWTGIHTGWKHRSHILSTETSKPLEISNPLKRVYETPKLDDDYGTEQYIERKIDSTRAELKQAIKKLKKKPVTVTV